MSENVLLTECLDEFFKNLEADATCPKDLVAKLESLRAAGKLTKGDNLRQALLDHAPSSGQKS